LLAEAVAQALTLHLLEVELEQETAQAREQ
jgi:hypothetical protein